MTGMADFSKDFTVAHDGKRRACSIRFRCFDTPNSITVYESGMTDRQIEDLLIGLFRECLELHRLWSFSSPESDIARVNGERASVRVDRRTARLLEAMKAFHEAEPLFDFTVGPVSFLWKRASRVPSEAELAERLRHVGADKVEVDGCVVSKRDKRVQVDVGGAAKGFAADWVVSRLRDAEVACADVDLGGNLYMVGRHPAQRPWRVAIRVPDGVEAERTVVEVVDRSVVTSGAYERFVEIGGKRYQHIVDPRTGYPSESDIVSATVIAESSLRADMLATTALLVGSSGFSGLAARHRDCDFLALTSHGAYLGG